MSKPGHTGFTRIIRATNYSSLGLRAAWRHESAFRQECAIAAFLLPASVWLGSNAMQTALLIAVVAIVLITELLNSAIEAVVDLASPELHPLAGRAKDLGSAAVFVSLLLAAGVWLLIAAERFL
jgi:diacylglycerol kinase (ATP)